MLGPLTVKRMTFRLLVLIALVLGGIAPVVVRAQLPAPLGGDEGPTLGRTREGAPWLDEIVRRDALESPEPRLDVGPIGLGLVVASRRPNLDLPGDLGSAATRYRLADTQLRATDLGLDLRLRWPSASDARIDISVVVPPAPDAPATRTSPRPHPSIAPILTRSRPDSPSRSSSMTLVSRVLTLSTTDSPCAVGTIETRT